MPEVEVPSVVGDPIVPSLTQQARVIPNGVMILSLFPVEMKCETHNAGGFTFVLPAAEKSRIKIWTANPEILYKRERQSGVEPFLKREMGSQMGYSALIVCDTFEWIRNHQLGEMQAMPRGAALVAQDLIRSWTSGISGPGSLGIGVYNPKRDLAEQLAELSAGLHMRFSDLVLKADRLAAQQDFVAIERNLLYRIAAEWLGLKERPWYRPLTPGETKDCPACFAAIPVRARTCVQCKTDLIEFCLKHEIDDPAVAEYLRVKKERAEKPSAPAEKSPTMKK